MPESKNEKPMISISTHLLEHRLRSIGFSWPELQLHASEIVVFGSTACGLASSSSDVDILCVGSGTTRITKTVDLLWVTPETIDSSEWLGSEIANHIAEHGKWLKGDGRWAQDVSISAVAVTKKRCQITSHVRAVMKHWDVLNGLRRQRQLQLIRRQLQRLEKLADATPVPATPLLDRAWNQLCEKPLNKWCEQALLQADESQFVHQGLRATLFSK